MGSFLYVILLDLVGVLMLYWPNLENNTRSIIMDNFFYVD